nr:MAG TPA: hypothetical protein [Caudoviricetes sp.]
MIIEVSIQPGDCDIFMHCPIIYIIFEVPHAQGI